MEDFKLLDYIYWEFSLSVLIGTEIVRFFLAKLSLVPAWLKYIFVKEPKWLTLIVALAIAAGSWSTIKAEFDLNRAITSLGVAVLGYDYVWKLIKDKFKTTSEPQTPTE